MKSKPLTMLLFLFVMLMALTIAAKSEDFKKGTYSAQLDGNWSVKFDEDNKVTVTRNGEVAAEGTYKISGDEIEIRDKSGPMSCGAENLGKYKWRLDGDKLTFIKVADECEGRGQALTSQAWTRNKSTN